MRVPHVCDEPADDLPAPKRRLRTFRAGTRDPFLALPTIHPPDNDSDNDSDSDNDNDNDNDIDNGV